MCELLQLAVLNELAEAGQRLFLAVPKAGDHIGNGLDDSTLEVGSRPGRGARRRGR